MTTLIEIIRKLLKELKNQKNETVVELLEWNINQVNDTLKNIWDFLGEIRSILPDSYIEKLDETAYQIERTTD